MNTLKTSILCVAGHRYIELTEYNQAGDTVRTCSTLDPHPGLERPAAEVLRERIAELRARAAEFNRQAGFLATALPPVIEDQGPETRDQAETRDQGLKGDQDPTPNAPARLQFIGRGEYGGELVWQAVSHSGLSTLQVVKVGPDSFYVENWFKGTIRSCAGPVEKGIALEWAQGCLQSAAECSGMGYRVTVNLLNAQA